jgi:hypothetical protein
VGQWVVVGVVMPVRCRWVGWARSATHHPPVLPRRIMKNARALLSEISLFIVRCGLRPPLRLVGLRHGRPIDAGLDLSCANGSEPLRLCACLPSVAPVQASSSHKQDAVAHLRCNGLYGLACPHGAARGAGCCQRSDGRRRHVRAELPTRAQPQLRA